MKRKGLVNFLPQRHKATEFFLVTPCPCDLVTNVFCRGFQRRITVRSDFVHYHPQAIRWERKPGSCHQGVARWAM